MSRTITASCLLAGVAAQGMPLKLFDLKKYPNAICNDGTPSGMYVQPSSSGSNLWIIFQQGGGWCWNKQSCEGRSGNLVSSKGWSQTHASNGLLASNVAPLADANKVYVPYCTSDAYMGSIDAADVPFGFAFHGRAVVDAVFAELAATYGMGSTPGTQIMYTGCSAGARGVMFNTDHIMRQVLPTIGGANIAAFGVFLDSVFWIDMAPFSSSVTPFMTQAADMLTMSNATGNVDPACIAAHSASEQWKCIYGQYCLPYVRAPFLLHSFQYDQFQLSQNEAVPVPTTGPELAYAETFRTFTRGNASADVPNNGTVAAMLPACYKHCNTESSTFATLQTNGYTLEQAVVSWWATVTGSAATVPRYVQDNCTGFNCGTGCPAP